MDREATTLGQEGTSVNKRQIKKLAKEVAGSDPKRFLHFYSDRPSIVRLLRRAKRKWRAAVTRAHGDRLLWIKYDSRKTKWNREMK